MIIVKQIVKVVWPIVFKQLFILAKKTTTPFDDMAVIAANEAVEYWLELDQEEEDENDLNLR